MNQDEAYEQPFGWMQQLVSETDGEKTIRYTFTKTRIGKNDIPIYFQDALAQPAPKNCTPLDEYIAEMEKDPEIKHLLDIAREDVKKWSTQSAKKPVAFINKITGKFCTSGFEEKNLDQWTPLYTHPAPLWQGLSESEVDYMWEILGDIKKFARAIEQALKEKNHG